MAPEGGFYATQDADSEGEEGKYFVWEQAELNRILNEDESRLIRDYYGVTDTGNFEGKNILNRLGGLPRMTTTRYFNGCQSEIAGRTRTAG